MVRSANKTFQAGLVMGLPDLDSKEWYGFRVKRHETEGDVVCLDCAWGEEHQSVVRVALDDDTNSFTFALREGKLTASVNGRQIFYHGTLPRQIQAPENAYLLGLGAFGAGDDTVIRYRAVQLRELR